MAFIPHNYDSPALPALIEEGMGHLDKLMGVLHAIQEMTGIPGLHTDANSDDQTPGVLERLQDMWDCGTVSTEAFREFDEETDEPGGKPPARA